jgi:hypothetical protein
VNDTLAVFDGVGVIVCTGVFDTETDGVEVGVSDALVEIDGVGVMV